MTNDPPPQDSDQQRASLLPGVSDGGLEAIGLLDPPPTRIGPYDVIEKVGEGGMGIVYLAERTQPVRQRVAVKLIKLGMDTREVIARFNSERQALGLMNHPNIATVYDSGATEQGRPYFVMEYVPGIPIVEYCDRSRLTNHERLELFTQVCAAIQHAHQKGIIHRDIKPSNVLVSEHDGRPLPKVIDFGVAKATDQRLLERTFITQNGRLLGTPDYMSPEQAEMTSLDVDTRTDVYSLGVMLYELLVGLLPFDPKQLRSAGYSEILRVIREVDPPRPSVRFSNRRAGQPSRGQNPSGATTDGSEPKRLSPAADTASIAHIASCRRATPKALRRQLKGDLDWILMKAMSKNRTHRYASVSEFAADIGRYLRHEPVVARPPSVTYRLRKLVQKNRLAAGALAMVVLTLVAGLLATSYLYIQADRARQSEQREHKLVQAEKERADQETERLRRALYANRIAAAQRDYEAHHLGRMRESLDACPPDLRGWEWHYLHRLSTDMPLLTMDAHQEGVLLVAVTSDGQRIISGGVDGVIRLWEASKGTCLQSFHLNPGGKPVKALAVGPGGRSAASVTADEVIRLWDLATGREGLTLDPSHGEVNCLAFSPDERFLATGGDDGRLRLWASSSGELLRTIKAHHSPVTCLAFSPEGRMIASGEGRDRGKGVNEVKICDIETGTILRTIAAHPTEISCLAFSPDGRRLASGSTKPHWRDEVKGTLKMWDTGTGAELTSLRGNEGHVLALAFSPDGRRLACGGEPMHNAWQEGGADYTLRIWDTFKGVELSTVAAHEGAACGLAWLPSSNRLVSAGRDGEVRVWSGDPTPMCQVLGGHESGVERVVFSPDGRRLISCGMQLSHDPPSAGGPDNTIRLWDLSSGAQLALLSREENRVTAIAWNPDGRLIATGNESERVEIRDAADGRMIASLRNPTPGSNPSSTGSVSLTHSLAFSPDGSQLAAACAGSGIWIWNVADGKELHHLGAAEDRYLGVAYSPDGTLLASATAAGTIRLWNARSATLIRRIETDNQSSHTLTFSPDGRRVILGHLNGITVCDVPTGDEVLRIRPSGLEVVVVACTPDGRRIIGGVGSLMIGVWDAETGQEMYRFRAHDEMVSFLQISPDGTQLASCGYDGLVKIWNGTSGE